MSVIVGAGDRADILQYASALLPRTDRADAALVASWAGPLLSWAEQAEDKADLRARMQAMFRQHSNSGLAKRGDPAEFITQARTHYEFIYARI